MGDTRESDRAVAAVWRHESTRLIAGLVRMTHDVGLAEDLAQDALVAAVEQWAGSGVPDNPGAWLMAVAKRRAVDHFRRAETLRRKTEELGRDAAEWHVPDFAAAVDYIEDDVLRLMFMTCHPVLSTEARVALTLRLVGGLTTTEIARGFLAKDATIGQRVSRAKKTLTEARVEFDLPTGPDRRERLAAVMGVIYLVFNEGYSATAGDDWMRPALCEEAMRLARILAHLAPDEPEAHGLQALLEIQASRTAARTGADGKPVLLLDQDRSRWDRLLIRRGLDALDRADKLDAPVGPYVVQAAIAACHARAARADDTDWTRIAGLYDVLGQVAPNPVVEVNRAVAHGMAFGPEAGLAVLEPVEAGQALAGYHLLASVKGDLLGKAGRRAEARAEFERAAALTGNARERDLLLQRAKDSS
ncbi:RNA polymerase sigma factor [Actinokineospora sp. HUAS TT18]|uniref:RNA polymerase sigma factor n=1 Tax=Actinokineospora sp. HUAS TT18 TaxID=3447451 RepID=UPI003F52208D